MLRLLLILKSDLAIGALIIQERLPFHEGAAFIGKLYCTLALSIQVAFTIGFWFTPPFAEILVDKNVFLSV
jgi:hypothetical protein